MTQQPNGTDQQQSRSTPTPTDPLPAKLEDAGPAQLRLAVALAMAARASRHVARSLKGHACTHRKDHCPVCDHTKVQSCCACSLLGKVREMWEWDETIKELAEAIEHKLFGPVHAGPAVWKTMRRLELGFMRLWEKAARRHRQRAEARGRRPAPADDLKSNPTISIAEEGQP
jgi:hypothetical protein